MDGKRKRRICITFVTFLFIWIGAIAFALRRGPEDIAVRGGPLSQHLFALSGVVARGAAPIPGESAHTAEPKVKAMFAKMEVARRSLLSAGTNAIPLLAKWMGEQVPPWKLRVGRWLWKQGFASSVFPPTDRRIVACRGIMALAGDGLPLVPLVASACTNSDLGLAAEALSTLTSQCSHLAKFPPSLLDEKGLVLDEEGYSARLEMLRMIREHAEFILKINGKPIEEQARILRVLSRRNESFGASFSVLLSHFESDDPKIVENAAICFRNYGWNAIVAAPLLRKALDHPSERVRLEVAKALERITALASDPEKRF
jgi:hypothetical protein